MEISLIGEALDFGSNDCGFESRISNMVNYLANNPIQAMTVNNNNYVINILNQRNIKKPLGILMKSSK